MSEFEAEDLPEKEIGNEGLKKKILRKGNSWQTPFPGDEVHVHYTGKLQGNGEYFDSSREKGTPFTFKFGQGEVIKGWDIGIGTMRKGERALYTIPPCLGYGKLGSPPIIPPDSTLVFDIEMLWWNSVRDVSGDGGILKKIVREGEGWATPRDADQVLVKYTMRTENKEDVVSESNDGVEFSLTEGFLCPAMSKAVKTMRKGEIADISVKPTYGFGALTNENTNSIIGSIPPNSNLSIHLELLSWKSVTDVTGDKKVLKTLIKAGEGYERPNEGALVKVVCIGKLEDGTIVERKGSDQEPFEYLCLEEQIVEDLDRAIMTMRKGEEARVRISSDYFRGCKEKTELSPLIYEIKLLDFTKEKPFWKMETREKIEACERKKQEGNLLFKSRKFQRASKKYEKECGASKYIEFDHSFTADEKRQANALNLSCSLNNAACKLKLEDFLEASRLCSKALGLDPCNIKALFRRSQAYLRMSELEKAEIDIKQALALDPDNRDVKLVQKELRQRQKQYAQHEVKFFSAMLSRIE